MAFHRRICPFFCPTVLLEIFIGDTTALEHRREVEKKLTLISRTPLAILCFSLRFIEIVMYDKELYYYCKIRLF
jgi:hypothetical protein